MKYARIREDVPATVYFPHSQIFGAERDAILGMVLRETAAIVLAGLAVGVPAAWAASNLLKTRLFGLTPHDPWSIGLSVVATLLVTMLAGYIPARRASRVDPMVALRYE